MYKYSNKFSQKKKSQTMQIENDFKKNANTAHTTNKSQILVNSMKSKSFRKIFSLLDTDEDKQISIFCHSLQNLPQNILKLIQPILMKLKEENCIITENEFVDYCDMIYNVKSKFKILQNLTNDNKYFMLNFEKKCSASVEKKKIIANNNKTNLNGNKKKVIQKNPTAKSMTYDSL